MTDLPPVQHDAGHQRFTVRLEGHEAELTYHLRDAALVIDHTGVPEAIGGRGVASVLVRAAFDYARAQGWRVIPACSYARDWIVRHPDYAGLVTG